jgi:ribosomal protein S18 acetylase RimI-like enzyme
MIIQNIGVYVLLLILNERVKLNMEIKGIDKNVKIRPITENDTEIIYEYFMSFSEETRYFFTPHALDKKFAQKLTEEDIKNPDTRRFIVVTLHDSREIVVGYFFFWGWIKKIPWFGIGVRDGYHGMGIGSKMLDYAINKAKRYNKGGILLTTKKDNIKAQGLYRKFGFEIIGEEPSGQYLLILNFKDEAT